MICHLIPRPLLPGGEGEEEKEKQYFKPLSPGRGVGVRWINMGWVSG